MLWLQWHNTSDLWDFGPFFIWRKIMDIELKGYFTQTGYMGWTGKKYMLFASESDYIEYMRG